MLNVKEYIFLSFPFLVIFFFIPSELYHYNISEWDNDLYLILFPLLVAIVIYIFCIIVIYVISFISPLYYISIKKWLPWLFVNIGIFILLSDLLAPLQLTQLDGSNLKSNEPILITIIEVLLLIGTILLFINRKKMEKIIYDISVLFLIIAIVYLVFNIYISNQDKNLVVKNTQVIKNKLPNIYHLHLDAMQTDYFLYNIKMLELEDNFEGFTLFKKNLSNYPYSLPSIASYLTSTTYQSGKYTQWLKNLDNGLISDLKELGYSINIFGKKSLLPIKNVDSFVTADEIYKKQTGITHPMLTQFSSIVTARIFPNFYTNEALRIGKFLGKYLSFTKDTLQQDYPKTIAQGIEPYIGVKMLKHIKDTEIDRKAHGEYLYALPTIPHGPYVINNKCEYNAFEGNTASKYMQQVQCSTSLVISFLESLKKMNRYDNSIIIIHGDHGSGWAGFLDVKSDGYHNNLEGKKLVPFNKKIHPWSKSHLECRSMALLMIKPPLSKKKFQVNSDKTDLLDIYPTLASLLSIKEKKNIEGHSLISKLKKENKSYAIKDQFFYYFLPGKGEKEGITKIQIDFEGNYPMFSGQTELNYKQGK